MDPRTPVLVGCGQVVQRKVELELERAREPLALMHEALLLAAEDAGAPGLLSAADSIRVPRGLWEYANPGAWLAEQLGASATETALPRSSRRPGSNATARRLPSRRYRM